jgi:hypothetical protein
VINSKAFKQKNFSHFRNLYKNLLFSGGRENEGEGEGINGRETMRCGIFLKN